MTARFYQSTAAIQLLIFIFAFTGCSRSVDEAAKINLDLSALAKQEKVGSFNISNINFIAINISNRETGFSLKCFLDGEDGHTSITEARWKGPCVAPPTNPLSVEINNVTTGSDRLVQVLLIEKDSSSPDQDLEFFSYGENRTSIENGENSVDIRLDRSPSPTNKNGLAIGQYVTSGGLRPSGRVKMLFAPPTGSEPMELFTFEIFNGWFEFFLLDNINVAYQHVRSGKFLFRGPVTQTSAPFATPGDGLVTADVPQTYDFSGDFSDPQELLKIGFWRGGEVDNSQLVCKDDTPTQNSGKFVDPAGSDPLDWATDGTNDISNSGGKRRNAGCSFAPTDDFLSTTRINLKSELFTDSDGGGFLIYGGFTKFLNSTGSIGFLDFSSGTDPIVSWKYVPGAFGPGKITGTTVFYSQDTNNPFSAINDGPPSTFDCRQLETAGFNKTRVAAGVESATLRSAPSDIAQVGTIIICPERGLGDYWGSVIGTDNRAPSNGGGSNLGFDWSTGRDGDFVIGDGAGVNAVITIGSPTNTIGSGHSALITHTPLANPPSKVFSHQTLVVDLPAPNQLVLANYTTLDEIDSNDLIFWHVVSASAPSDPENACGGGLKWGSYGFARVISTNPGGSSITLDRDIASAAIPSATLTGLPTVGTLHCRLQATRVPELGTVDLATAGSQLVLQPRTLDLASGIGGVAVISIDVLQLASSGSALRVGGYDSAGAYVGPVGYLPSASNKATFFGGERVVQSFDATGSFLPSISPVNSGGGGAGAYGSGGNANGSIGGGQGLGGSPPLFCSGPCDPISGSNDKRIFYGGSGAGDGTNSGAQGGGIVMLFIRNIEGTGGMIEANVSGDVTGTSTKGAGGAGTIVFVNETANNATANSTFSLAGGEQNGGGEGGSGGGGLLQISSCSTTPSLTPSSILSKGPANIPAQEGTPGLQLNVNLEDIDSNLCP